MPRKAPLRLEDSEQKTLVNWFRCVYRDVLIVHIPNGLIRSKPQASYAKALGLVAGFPDLFICRPVGQYAGMFIELKRPRFITHQGVLPPGKPTVAQEDVIRHLNQAGYLALICYGFDDAQRAIISYMEG